MSAVLREQLQTIYDDCGELTPAAVVDTARDQAHPLHSRFEWDDSLAGEAYRRQQAHDLIRSVRVVYREADEKHDAKSVRAFHAVRDRHGHHYEPVEKVQEDPFLRQLVIADMEREWKQLHRRYQHMAEFLELVRQDVRPAA